MKVYNELFPVPSVPAIPVALFRIWPRMVWPGMAWHGIVLNTGCSLYLSLYEYICMSNVESTQKSEIGRCSVCILHIYVPRG